MQKYCYSKDMVLTRFHLLNEMDLSLFFESDFQNPEHTRKLLEAFGIYLKQLDLSQSTIKVRMVPIEKDSIVLPNISNRYYNQEDALTSVFSVQPQNSTLLSLEGEIFESLDLDLEGAYAFSKKYGYDKFIYPETTSCIHFKGIEFNRWQKEDYDEMVRNIGDKVLSDKEKDILALSFEKTKETKEVYIIKDAKQFMFYYNSPHIFNNCSKSGSLSVEEIGMIQKRILELLLLNGQQKMSVNLNVIEKTQNDNEEFLKYVYAYLMLYRKIVANKGYQEHKYPIFNEESLQVLKNCVCGKIPKEIYAKITIISDTPIQTTEEKNLEFIKTL